MRHGHRRAAVGLTQYSKVRMRIALVRHAPVQFSANRWISPNGVREAVANYNQASVACAGAPQKLQELTQSASVVFASSLPRSIRTAEALAPDREVLKCGVFDEAPLPSIRGPIPLLPVRLWFIVLRVLWLLGWADGTEPKSRALVRARVAAEQLVLASGPDRLVVLVGHGIFMALLARSLEEMGWRRLGPLPRRPWSTCSFVPSK